MLQFHIPEGKRILNIGCGLGDMLASLRPSLGVGVDGEGTVIEAARRRHPDLMFGIGEADGFEVEAGPFDYIVLANAVGGFRDVQSVFRHMRRYAGPHTRIIIAHYNYLWEPVLKLGELLALKIKEPYQNWLPLGEIDNLLALEGFETIRTRQCVLLPKKVPLLSWFLNRIGANLPLLWRFGLVEMAVARVAPSGNGLAKGLSVSVVIPARNERGNIESIIRSIPPMGSSVELVFVEGHSNDGTYEMIEQVAKLVPKKRIKLLKQHGEGKGDAVREGFEHATGDVVIIYDADMTVAPEDLPKFYDAVATGKGELVIGNRLVYQQEEEAMRFLNLLGNKLFGMIFTYILGQRIKDTLCGTKALLRSNYGDVLRQRQVFGKGDPFGDFDLIFGAAKAGLKISEIPVRYRSRKYGKTQIRRFYHGLLLFRMAWRGIRKIKFV